MPVATQTTIIELYVMKKIAVVHRGKVIIIKHYRLSHYVVTYDVYRFDCILLVFIRRAHVITSTFDWFTGLSVPLIG